MAKKIGIIIVSLGIIITGIFAFNRMHYGERSVRIFTLNNRQTLGRGFDRQGTNFERSDNRERTERFERPNLQNLPDSVVMEQFQTFRRDRNSFREGNFNGYRRGRGGFHHGRNVQLRNVGWFLAVFALFTVGTIYIDKTIHIIRKKK